MVSRLPDEGCNVEYTEISVEAGLGVGYARFRGIWNPRQCCGMLAPHVRLDSLRENARTWSAVGTRLTQDGCAELRVQSNLSSFVAAAKNRVGQKWLNPRIFMSVYLTYFQYYCRAQ